MEEEGRVGCVTNRPGHRGRKEALHLHKKWYKQESGEAGSKVSQSNSGSSGAAGVGDTPEQHGTETMREVRAGSEGGSKKEQGIKTLQKLGFCRRSCVQGWDVGKGDMGATLTVVVRLFIGTQRIR